MPEFAPMDAVVADLHLFDFYVTEQRPEQILSNEAHAWH